MRDFEVSILPPLVGAPLVGNEFAVEIEVDAVVDKPTRRRSSWLARVIFFTGVTLAGVTLGAVMRRYGVCA